MYSLILYSSQVVRSCKEKDRKIESFVLVTAPAILFILSSYTLILLLTLNFPLYVCVYTIHSFVYVCLILNMFPFHPSYIAVLLLRLSRYLFVGISLSVFVSFIYSLIFCLTSSSCKCVCMTLFFHLTSHSVYIHVCTFVSCLLFPNLPGGDLLVSNGWYRGAAGCQATIHSVAATKGRGAVWCRVGNAGVARSRPSTDPPAVTPRAPPP